MVPRDLETNAIQLPLLLLGVLLGHHPGRFPDDFTPADKDRIHADAEFNAGVSLCMPINVVMDIIQSEESRAARTESMSIERSKVRYRPSISSSRDAQRPSFQIPLIQPIQREDP
jgi:hypothetical protein